MTTRSCPSALLAAALLFGAASTASAQGWLDVARWYFPYDDGEFHYIADMNADGRDDLVWFVGEPDTPTVWESFEVFFADASGDLTASGFPVAFPLGGTVFNPVSRFGVRRLSDVTGDGVPDALILQSPPLQALDTALLVFPGATDGSFGAALAIPINGMLDALTLGDLDNDGTDEVAVVDLVNSDLRITWFDWSGAAFVGAGSITINQSFGSPRVAGMAALDLDADADLDLVYGDWHETFLHVLFYDGNDLALGPDIDLGGASNTRLWPFVVDLAGGGRQDLLVVSERSNNGDFDLIPFLNPGTGVLTPGATQTFDTWADQPGSGFNMFDWDDDGDVDVTTYAFEKPAGSTEAIVAVYENDGTDTWNPEPAEVDLKYAGFWGPGRADLDGDGFSDYVGSQSVYFGNGRLESSLVEVTDFFFGVEPHVVADFEGDGDVDLFYKFAFVMRNDGTGAFGDSVGIPAPPPDLDWIEAYGIGDFTGDGLTDFLVGLEDPPVSMFEFPVFVETRLIAADGLGGFVDLGAPGTGSTSLRPFSQEVNIAVDFDQDGDVDLMDKRNGIVGGYWANDGTGNLTWNELFPNDPIAVGDLDGDTDLDVITYQGSATFFIERNDGGNVFTQLPFYDVPFNTIVEQSVTILDLDDDGDLDVAMSRLSSGEAILLMQNDGSGNFTIAAELSTDFKPSGPEYEWMHLGLQDVDGDGIDDFLAGGREVFSERPDQTLVFRGLGGGFAYEPVRIFVGTPSGPLADVDEDGDLDLTGRSIVRVRKFDGAADGSVRQFGTGTPGTGGAVPVLGASGPVRPGSTTAAVRLRQALGGTVQYLFYGFSEIAQSNFPFPGATFYIGDLSVVGPVLLPVLGPPGAAGQGFFDIPLGNVLASAVGVTVYIQTAVIDNGGGAIAAMSNGLEITFGF